MSHALTGLSFGEIARQSASSSPILEKRKHEFHELTYPTFRPTFLSKARKQHSSPFLSFWGAIISVDISVAINILNQSPTLSVREEQGLTHYAPKIENYAFGTAPKTDYYAPNYARL